MTKIISRTVVVRMIKKVGLILLTLLCIGLITACTSRPNATQPEELPEPVDYMENEQDLTNLPVTQPSPDRLMLVAHAGGAIDGFGGTNSLEAVYNSAAMGHLFIEVDFITTEDGEIVLNHDWDFITGRVPGAPNTPVTHSVFMQYRIFHRFTPMDLDMLIAFLTEHWNIRIITDTKDDDYAALHVIANRFPDYIYRFIPQAYAFEDVPYIKALGFEDVIVTLYELPHELLFAPAEIAALIDEWRDRIFGVAIFDGLLNAQYVAYLDLSATRFFAHTVNCAVRALELQAMGFYGIYTGYLLYDSEGELTPILGPQTDALINQMRARLGLMEDTEFISSIPKIYQFGAPIYLAHGQPRAINETRMANIFTRHGTGELYLPVRHFADAMQSYEWRRWEHDSTSLYLTIITYSGEVYHMQTNDTDGPIIHRTIPFISKSTIESIFPYRVILLGDYVVVLPNSMDWDSQELFTIAETVFG
jgi:glycerophosphoryl diester phosphodiesterase